MENYQNKNRVDDRTTTQQRMSIGTFRDRESTERAYNMLKERGYTQEEINMIMSDDTRKKYFSGDARETEIGTKAAEDAGKGSAIGGTIGAIAGVIAAIGTSLVIPGLGLVIAGPIAAGLAGAGAGGLAGGIIGALIGSGIPEERAKLYEEDVKNGDILIGVQPHNDVDAEYIESTWKNGRNNDDPNIRNTQEGNLNEDVDAGDEGTLRENTGDAEQGHQNDDVDVNNNLNRNAGITNDNNRNRTNAADEDFLRGYEDDEMDTSTLTDDDDDELIPDDDEVLDDDDIEDNTNKRNKNSDEGFIRENI